MVPVDVPEREAVKNPVFWCVLTPSEKEEALAVAKRRYEDAEAAGRTDRFGVGSLHTHELGAMGEMCVRIYLGTKEPLTCNTFQSMPDVAGVEVRTARRMGMPLRVKPRDADGTIAVGVNQADEDTFVLMGWIRAGDAKKVQAYYDAKPPESWCVPVDDLRPLWKLLEGARV